MTFKEINKEIKDYQYPPNYMFDAETLIPYGVLAKRSGLMKKNVPEFYEGGNTFLDIGCNKGYWMFHLQDKYKKIIGYELDGRQVEIADNIKDLHGFKNIQFKVGTFKDIPKNTKADVVYLGGVHHHIFVEDLKRGLKPMDFVHKLKKMAKKYLIIDGVMNYWGHAMSCDTGLIKNHNIKPEVYEQYNLETIKEILSPQFELVRAPWDGIGDDNFNSRGTGGRYCCVFKRK